MTFWHHNIIDDRISSVLFLVSSSNSYSRLFYLPFHSTNNQVRFDTLFHQSIQLYLPLIETLQSFNAHIFEHDKQNFKSRSGNYHKLNLKRIIRSENWKMKAQMFNSTLFFRLTAHLKYCFAWMHKMTFRWFGCEKTFKPVKEFKKIHDPSSIEGFDILPTLSKEIDFQSYMRLA